MNQLSIGKTGLVVGALAVLFFALCMVWGTLLPTTELQTVHRQLLQISYPGFSMTLGGMLLGAVESFIYGAIVGLLFAWLCRRVCGTKSECA